jgi:SpoVK/Ycf46/Vps4 family AAA+-type ATPase
LSDEALDALRDAVRISPENMPLRLHLAETLLSKGFPEEAEREFKQGIALAPDHAGLKLGLARAFDQQGKSSAALVIVEELTRHPNPPAKAHLLYARLLHRAGEIERAVRQYKKAIESDPAVADIELSSRLGIRADSELPSDQDEVIDGKVRAPSSTNTPELDPDIEVERPIVRFKDVGGLETLKDEIRMKIIHPLEHAELYKAYGKAIGGGILMYGPPGCGKTYLARATAGEISASFISIGINDVLDMWIGSSEKNLHAVFEQARRTKPCVLFFDEVDALAASRTDMRTHGGRHLINQFLAELDGISANNDGLLILAATNAPWHVDAAFRRPGRFDRILFVPPPDAPARAAILRAHLRGKPLADIDYDHVAKKADGLSGADLKAVVDTAIEAKLREAMKKGIPAPLTTRDLVQAIAGVKPSTREWFGTARNYALYSNQGGVYDDVLKYLKL